MPSSYALGEHFEHFIKQELAGGRYATASEVIRDALRLLELERRTEEATIEALRTEVRKGRASVARKPAEEVLGRLEQKYKRQALARRAK